MYDADTDIDEYGDADRHRDSGANPFCDEHEHKYADEYAYLYGDEYGNGDTDSNTAYRADVYDQPGLWRWRRWYGNLPERLC